MKSPSNIRSFLWGVVGLLLAWFAQRQVDPKDLTFAAVLFVGAAVVCVWAFVSRQQSDETVDFSLVKFASTFWLGVVLAAFAVGLTVLMALRMDVENPTATDWSIHIGSVLLFLIAAYFFDAKAALPPLRFPALAPRHPFWLLLLIVAIAAFFRFYKLSELPFGVWYDEGMHALLAERILNEPTWRPIFLDYDYNGPAHYAYLAALFFDWFGVSIFAMRAINALFGTFTVIFAYLAGREIFDRRSGLIVAFLVAVSGWSVINSRFAVHTSSTVPFFVFASTFFVLRSIKSQRTATYIWAGFWIGLGLNTYSSFRVVAAILIFFVLYKTVYLKIVQKANLDLRKTIFNLCCLLLMMGIVVAPLGLFAWQRPEIFWERIEEAFILRDKTADQYLPVLFESIRKHLLMFNVAGDQNGRHNLPGMPMLDQFSAALLAMGFFLSLVRMFRPRHFLLLALLLLPLLGGILSIDFEAPQAHRSSAALPAAYLLATLPLFELWRAWDRGAKPYSKWLALPLSVLMIVVGYVNYDFYFNRYANDFAAWNAWSTPETLAAKFLNELPPDTEPYLINYFHGHPSIRFLTDGKLYQDIQTTDHLPLDWPPDKNVELMLNLDSRNIYDEARQLYPNAVFEEVTPPFPGPVALFRAYLSQEDLKSIQGLSSRYFRNDSWSGEAAFAGKDLQINADWSATPPLALPFSVEWEGVLHVRSYGAHQFFLRAPNKAELYIGEEKVLDGEGELSAGVVLATGNHAIRLRALGGAGAINLSWKTPEGEVETIPPSALLTGSVRSNGLLGRFFPNGDWQQPEQFARIDPELNLYFHIIPLPRPYTVEWSGKIAIPQSGDYGFGLESIDESTLSIDGQQLLQATVGNQEEATKLYLEAGLHDILIRYVDRTDHSHINLYWSPPGFGRQPVPSQVLFPPQGNYERISVPELAQLYVSQQAQPTIAPVQGKSEALPAEVNVLPLVFNSPFGIAAGANGQIYVADTGNKRMAILNNQGELLKEVSAADTPLDEPFDVATDSAGLVYLLDAALGRVAIYDSNGDYVGNIPTPQGAPERSRGIFVDSNSHIWFAHTAGSRVFAVDLQGNPVMSLNMQGEEGAQPIDVAVGSSGNIYVTDGDRHTLIFFSAQGERIFSLDLEPANTLAGPHMAVDSYGFLYITNPEAGQVLKFAADGQQLGYYNLRAAGIVRPVGVAVDSSGKIWVADIERGQVAVITPPEAQALPVEQPATVLPETTPDSLMPDGITPVESQLVESQPQSPIIAPSDLQPESPLLAPSDAQPQSPLIAPSAAQPESPLLVPQP